VIRVAFRESSQLLRLPAPFAARGSLHEGGGAKLLLAYSPDDIIDEVIAKHLDAFVPATLRTREAVLKLLENIRRDGYYLAIGELHPDVFTITAPVRDADGRVVAAIGVMGPTSRINPERTDRLIKCVVEGAEQISRRLG
jgi:IclR family KDG regulon transcriptional repressor